MKKLLKSPDLGVQFLMIHMSVVTVGRTQKHGFFYSGWWFQTFFIFRNIWDNPSHRLIFFKIVKTTNQYFFFVVVL